MKTIIVIILISIGSLSEAKTFNIGIGESITLPTQPLKTLRVQKKGILKVRDLGSKLILTGKKLGETRLHLGNQEYFFRVLRKNHYQTLLQLEKWLQGKRGPRLAINNGKPEIHGRILTLEDFTSLQDFTNAKSTFQIRGQLHPFLENELTAFIQKLLNENNLPSGELVLQPHLQLRIDSKQKANRSRYKKLLAPFGVELIVDPLSLTQQPVIQIKVYVAHIKKSFMRQWGLQWPTTASATIVPGSAPQISSFQVSLQALEEQGWGQTLATPTLVTESGQEAEFHSGGEFPIRTTTQFNNNVQWKRYGLFLKARPIANARGNFQIHIDLEVSTLDHSHSSQEVPALNRSQVKTQINMDKPRPFLLSGFLQQNENKNSSGLPWLKQIPIFSPLFATGQIYDSELELVFIMVPSFYEP